MFEYDPAGGDDVPRSREVGPEQHDMSRAPVSALKGGDAAENAEILQNILSGKDTSPRRDVAVLNAAYALQTSGRFDDIDACIGAANDAIDSGKATETLNRLINVSNEAPIE